MANLIQIKRSLDTNVPISLANGELAFTANGDVLYIGSNSSVVAIGGKRVPGTLTANQALVANSTGYLDEIRTSNLVVTKVYSNGSFGTTNQVLTANSTGGTFWATPVTNLDGLSDVVVTSASAGQVLVSNSTGYFRNVSVSGDITIDASGVATIAADSVVLGTDTTGDYVQSITAGNGISGTISSEGAGATIAVVTGTNGGIVANTTGLFVDAGNGLSTNSTGLHVGAGNGLGVDATNVYVVANSGIASNATGVHVIANNGISANATGVYVVQGTGVTVNSTGVHIGQAVSTTSNVTFNDITINGNTFIGSNYSDIVSVNAGVNTNIIPAANVTYSLGNNTVRWNELHAANVHTASLTVDTDATINGNLTVSGSLVTINVATLAVTDSLIQLASNNVVSDTLDIGFFGNYNNGVANVHAGLFRDATTDTFKLFKGLEPEPTTTVNISGTGYTQAVLETYLSSGALVSNSTAVTLTANSTVAVNITANSITFSSPLPGTQGGTGLASYTTEDILVANSSNGFRKLAVGSEGYVLQVSSGVVAYGTLDGGTF